MPETLEASLQLSEAVLVDVGLAMGPVIAWIHEKRAALRSEIMAEAELENEPTLGAPALARRLGRDLLQRVADRRERLLAPSTHPARRPGPCRDGRRRPARQAPRPRP